MVYNLRITDLPLSERPRERLLELGSRNLSTAEANRSSRHPGGLSYAAEI